MRKVAVVVGREGAQLEAERFVERKSFSETDESVYSLAHRKFALQSDEALQSRTRVAHVVVSNPRVSISRNGRESSSTHELAASNLLAQSRSRGA
jgi:hypothetical protein